MYNNKFLFSKTKKKKLFIIILKTIQFCFFFHLLEFEMCYFFYRMPSFHYHQQMRSKKEKKKTCRESEKIRKCFFEKEVMEIIFSILLLSFICYRYFFRFLHFVFFLFVGMWHYFSYILKSLSNYEHMFLFSPCFHTNT